MDPIITLLGIVAIVALIGVSAFFSSSELAVFSVAHHRVDALAAADVPGAVALARLREDPHRFLVTALVSNNVANIAAASLATAVLVQFLTPSGAATGATVVTSFFVIVFGEIAPKSYAVAHAERHALRVAGPISVIQRVLRPVLYVFEASTAAVNRVTGGDSEFESYLTREEIETLVLTGERSGALDAAEGAMIRSVLDLVETSVTAVMVPRADVIAVSRGADLDEIVETGARERVTRLPVYGENRDDVIGVVDIRDALRVRDEDGSIDDIVVDPHLVPETKPVDELLSEMQREGTQMAVVVDEFGSVTGLVTVEDLVEEVVGEIVAHDETDPVQPVDDTTAIVRGWATVAYVNERLGIHLPTDGGFETVAGLINANAGRLAEEGDRVELGTVTLEVLEATPTRIRRVRIDWQPTDDTPAVGRRDPTESE